MTTFRFEAARADGATVRGTIEAATVPEVAATLADRGLFPTSVEARDTTAARPAPVRAQAAVFHSLASLVETGVPLQQALAVTMRVSPEAMHESLSRVAARVHDGGSLGAALASAGTYSSVAVGLIKAGERGVGLAAALAQAAAYLERQAEMASRIRTALAYPLLLAVVGVVAIVAIVLVVIPRFATLLEDLGQTLPLATRLLLGISVLAQSYGLLLAAGALGAALALRHLIREHHDRWHGLLLRLPLIGPVRRGLATARAARTLGALLGSGTPALTALEIAREATGDAAIARELLEAKSRVAQGMSLSAAIAGTRGFTPAAVQLAFIGDQAGRLPALLGKAADLEELEAQRRLHLLVSFLEPALILVFAGVVAFVGAALLQAVYALRPGMG